MLNKVMLIGNLGKDPEIKYTPEGLAIAKFSMATKEQWKDKDGKKQDKTEWHNIIAFGKLAEICGEYLTKGKQVYIEGKIQTRSWDDKDGNKKYMTEIVANTMQMLGNKEEKKAGRKEWDEEGHGHKEGKGNAEEDVPF